VSVPTPDPAEKGRWRSAFPPPAANGWAVSARHGHPFAIGWRSRPCAAAPISGARGFPAGTGTWVPPCRCLLDEGEDLNAITVPAAFFGLLSSGSAILPEP